MLVTRMSPRTGRAQTVHLHQPDQTLPPRYNKRPVPGHPLRYSSKKAKKPNIPLVVPKTVYLIDEVLDGDSDYSLTESMILVKAECDLKSTYTEEDIRSELADIFKVKLPFIQKTDFDFVRRERSTITTPVVKADHHWDFKHVKHLCGQGKLYVRLNVNKHLLEPESEGSEITDGDYICEDKPSEENCSYAISTLASNPVNAGPSSVIDLTDASNAQEQAGTSSGI